MSFLEAIESFFGSAQGPSIMRVAFYTLVTTSLIFFALRGLYDVEVLVFSLAFAIIGNFFFDYVNLPRRGSY